MAKRVPNVFVVGLGGQAHVIASIVSAQGYLIKGFIDAFGPPKSEAEIRGLYVLGGLEYLRELKKPLIALAIGDNKRRAEVAKNILQVTPSASLIQAIHPRALVEDKVELGSHLTICAGAIIGTEASVGEGAIVNSGAIVEHEDVLGSYCHVSSGVQLGGRVRIGEFTHIGIGAAVIDKIRIGKHAVVGAGAVVIDDIPDYATAVGVPAKVIRITGP